MGTGGYQPSADVVAHDGLSMRTDSPRASSPGLPLQRERRDSDRGNPLVTGVHSRHGFSGASQLQGTALVRLSQNISDIPSRVDSVSSMNQVESKVWAALKLPGEGDWDVMRFPSREQLEGFECFLQPA
jgi:hypothetical protein